jgi:hypothetical protein
MKPYLFAFAIAGLSCSAWADQPPSWKEFSVKSENSKFEASVSVLGQGNKSKPWENRFRIQVRTTRSNGSPRVIWERPYEYDGYGGGILSNDGAYFVYVDYWYRHTGSAVRIYSHGASCSFTGEQLHVKEDSLEKTVSHRLWLNGEPKFVELRGKSVAVLVPTVQGKKHIKLTPKVSFNGAASRCDQSGLLNNRTRKAKPNG